MKQKLLSLGTGDGMRARALRGTTLSVLGFGGSQGIRLISNLILTRILFPEAFGLMALVQVFLIALAMFSDLGTYQTIIQSKHGDDPRFLNMAWTLQIARGVFLWLVACALASPVAQFYDQEPLAQVIPILGLGALITGFGSTRIASAYRHVTLGRLTLLEVGSQIVGTIFMILLALLYQSVWALVFGSLMTSFLSMVGSHIFLPGPVNKIGWHKPAFLEMFHFGKYIFFGTISGFFILHGDRMILGKFVNLEDLAIYTIALMFASIPLMLSSHLIDRIVLPLYRNRPPAESDKNRLQIGKVRFLLRFSFLCLAATIAFIGEPLITYLYDPRYYLAGPVLILLSLSMMPRIIISGYDTILLSNGNSRDFTILTIGSAILKIAMLLALVSQYGMLGAVIAPAIVDVLIYPFIIYTIRDYNGWYPLQDLVFIVFAILISVAALWNSPTVLNMLVEYNII